MSQGAGETGQEGQELVGETSGDDRELIFRAVSVGRERRGIRLERVFWDALGELAGERGMTLGAVVRDMLAALPPDGNLTSALRVAGMVWSRDRLARIRRRTSAASVFAVVQGCPSPAFVLTLDRRIVSYNQPFLSFIQTRFQAGLPTDMLRGMRLTLDLPLDKVMEKLLAAPGSPVFATGFVLGVADRRARGQVRIAIAPNSEQDMLVAFVVPG